MPTKETIISLENEISKVDFDISELNSFFKNSDRTRKQFLGAFKDLLVTFLSDLQNFDTENKTKITNFLCSEHKDLIENLIENRSLLDKINEIIDESVQLYGSETNTEDVDLNKLGIKIKQACEEAVTKFTSKSLIDQNSISRNLRSIKSLNSKKQTNSPTSKSTSISPRQQETISLPTNLVIKANKSILRSIKLVNRFIGVSTTLVLSTTGLQQSNKKITNFTNKLGQKFSNFLTGIKKYSNKENLKGYFKQNHNVLYSIFSKVGKVLSLNNLKTVFRSMDEWSKSYLKNFSLDILFPLRNAVPQIKNQTNSYLRKHPKLKAFFKVFSAIGGKVLDGFSFVTKHLFAITSKLVKLVSNPLKKIIGFAIKLIQKPWLMVLFGTMVGRVVFHLFDTLLNENKVFTGNERKVTDNMPYLEKLGSQGIFSTIQTEIDFIDKILEAAYDFFDLIQNNKKISESGFFKKLEYKPASKEEIEKKQEESVVYSITLNALIFFDEWFIGKDGSPPKLKTLVTSFFDTASNYLFDKLAKFNLKQEANKITGNTFSNKIFKTFETLQDINLWLDNIGNLLGFGFGRASARVGAHVTGKIVSRLPLPGWGRVVAPIFGGVLSLMVGRAFGENLAYIEKPTKTDKTIQHLKHLDRDFIPAKSFEIPPDPSFKNKIYDKTDFSKKLDTQHRSIQSDTNNLNTELKKLEKDNTFWVSKTDWSRVLMGLPPNYHQKVSVPAHLINNAVLQFFNKDSSKNFNFFKPILQTDFITINYSGKTETLTLGQYIDILQNSGKYRPSIDGSPKNGNYRSKSEAIYYGVLQNTDLYKNVIDHLNKYIGIVGQIKSLYNIKYLSENQVNKLLDDPDLSRKINDLIKNGSFNPSLFNKKLSEKLDEILLDHKLDPNYINIHSALMQYYYGKLFDLTNLNTAISNIDGINSGEVLGLYTKFSDPTTKIQTPTVNPITQTDFKLDLGNKGSEFIDAVIAKMEEYEIKEKENQKAQNLINDGTMDTVYEGLIIPDNNLLIEQNDDVTSDSDLKPTQSNPDTSTL